MEHLFEMHKKSLEFSSFMIMCKLTLASRPRSEHCGHISNKIASVH